MGDHRASIRIQFEAHGIKREEDMYINYFPGDLGIDERVVEFFRHAWDEMYAKYVERIDAWDVERRSEEAERAERAEWERLKKKYGARPHPISIR